MQTNRNDMIKGIMLDPARLTERRSVYYDMLPLLKEWGYNTLFWHFTDNTGDGGTHGCAMEFPSHPELAGKYAWSADETKDFVARARSFGIEVVPELECLGHTAYISDKYPNLRDGIEGKITNAISPVEPMTRSILKDLLSDICDIFQSPYIHVGMDEAAFGDHPSTKKALNEGRKKHELFIEHLLWLHAELKGHGKIMLMWGDHMLKPNNVALVDGDAHDEKIADSIPKDVIICDWHYGDVEEYPSVDFFLERGFKVLLCPACSCYGTIVYSHKRNFGNLKKFTRLATTKDASANVLGVVNTTWQAMIYAGFGALFPIMAYAGALQNGHSMENEEAFFKEFFSKTFGLPAQQAAKATAAHLLMVKTNPSGTIWHQAFPGADSHFADVNSKSEAEIAAAGEAGVKAQALLLEVVDYVSINRVYFDDIVFAAKCFVKIAESFSAKDPVVKLSIAENLFAEKKELWNRNRFEDDTHINWLFGSSCKYLREKTGKE